MSPRELMVRAMSTAVDTGDAESFASWFAEDATYTFGNDETRKGRAAIREATAGAAGALPWVRHTVDQVAEVGDQLFCRFTIHTEAPGGAALARHILDRPETVTGGRVLDLGAGSGIVGIAAAKAGAREVIAAEIDRYIAVPGQATAYMIGNLEIQRLRAEAEKALGSKFDLRAFHDLLLEDGTMPLWVLRDKVERWVAKAKQ